MLEANNIIFSYDRGREPVLDRVNLRVEPGERVGIFSPSGSGKTTLLKILSGYLVPEKGQVLVDGSPLPQRGFCPVQMVWQHPERAVNPRLTMKKILAEGGPGNSRLETVFGIQEDWKRRDPGELSGGELQRFCIVRALGEGTKYLLADEITAMLDFITQAQIWRGLIEETEKRQIGMAVVSHSRELLDQVCTRIVTLEELKN